MTMGGAFQLLLECTSPLNRSQISIDFSKVYDRVAHPDGELEASIDEIWKRRLAANPSLFNATKFRYGGYVVNDSRQVCLRLGLTDYRTFVGTNLSPRWEDFLTGDTDDVSRCKHTASPLGNGAVVETADSRIIVLQRSCNVGEFPGHLVFPGGHSEPLEIGITAHLSSAGAEKELNEKIANEMFDGIVREVCEETGVPASSLGEVLFIGISQRVFNVRPTAFFYVQCKLNSEEVLRHYLDATDSFESTKLCFVSKEDLPYKALEMPGCHQGGAALYTGLSRNEMV